MGGYGAVKYYCRDKSIERDLRVSPGSEIKDMKSGGGNEKKKRNGE